MKRRAVKHLLLVCGVGLLASGAIAGDASATLSTSRPYLYVGEQATLTLTLTTRDCEISGLSLDGMPPAINYELVSQLSSRPVTRKQAGRVLTEIRPFEGQIRGVKSGTIRMQPVLTAQLTETRMNGPFATRQTYTKRIPIAPYDITVRPLPPPPKGVVFNGGVGAFDVAVSLSSTNVAVGDLITIRSEIHGDGGCTRLALPEIAPGPHFRVYPTKTIEEQDDLVIREQVIVPQSEQADHIEPFTVSWFDSRHEHYTSQTFGPYPLTFHAQQIIEAGTYRPDDTEETNAPNTTTAPQAAERSGDALQDETTARLAPARTAAALFVIPKGVHVQPIRKYRGWATIEYAGRRGWIPLSAAVTVHGVE